MLAFRWATFRRQPWGLLFLCIALSGFIVLATLWELLESAWQGRIPTALTLAALTASILACALVLLLGISSTVAAVDAFQLWTLGEQRRCLQLEVDQARILTKDAMGTQLEVPWQSVHQTLLTGRLLLLQMKPRGWRWIPLRAFTPSDLARMREASGTVSQTGT
jgi:hypothetical protein